jgi:hypothetical protein
VIRPISAAPARPVGFWMPTNEQLKKTYGNIAENAIKSGSAKLLKHAPAGYKSAPSWDITPKGLMDMNKRVYLIKGELYELRTGFGMAGHWYKCGPAPLF